MLSDKVKVKSTNRPLKLIVRVEIQLYSFQTSTLVEGEWSSSHTNVFALEVRAPCPYLMRLCGSQCWSGCFRGEKNILLLLGFEPWIACHIA